MRGPLLLFLTIWLNTQLDGSAVSSSCSLPPSQWCSSLASAVQCGVLKECLESDFSRKHEKAEPVEVALYYESLCPGCRMYLTQILLPTWIMLQDIMTVSLVPYGNAQEKAGVKKYIFECQHGEQECLGNMIEACLLNTSSQAFSIIYCMESSSDVIKAAKSCVGLHDPSLDWNEVMSCVNGDIGNQLMHQNALKTKALKPSHQYVPWVTVNGVHTDELQRNATSHLFQLVCSMYKGPPIPPCGGSQRHFGSYCYKE
ncbi:gamma-interferon-inducible lysosomal thiol reductase [Nelusetta ayraudi]|uniref:gamma-interferon-inducible lysosomal thiol reductase n=1 Tax=Nelusetta ayraudi TaxID=303726 RepID=UPI003F6E6D44